MSSSFNLIDEPWILVRFPDGRYKEFGIKETLLSAKDIAGIEDSSPLVVASLHRFLLAVLYRALKGPTDIDEAKALFKSGLPSQKINDYLEKWRDRFWLFDEKYPFGQIPSFEPKVWRSWTALAAEHNADNAKVLFDHIDVEHPNAISAASATRWILATQTFSVSCGKSELSHTGTAPSATAVMVLPLGQSLNDTLLFALVPENREILSQDQPLWEREPETISYLQNDPARIATGIADRYTWRTRSVRLEKNENRLITRIAFASGIKNEPSGQTDPMLAYRIDENFGKLPIQFEEKGLWRDFASLLPDQSGLAPLVMEHAVTLARSDPKRFPRSVISLGQANKKAKIEFWRMERFALPEALSGNRSIRSDIKRLLEIAEATQQALLAATKSFARNILSKSARKGDRVPTGKDISAFIEQLPCTPLYWSKLETHFHEILNSYTLGKNPDDIELDWLLFMNSTLQEAWNQHRASVSTSDGWAIRALVKAESPINKKLMELDSKIKEFKASLQEEGA